MELAGFQTWTVSLIVDIVLHYKQKEMERVFLMLFLFCFDFQSLHAE